LESSPGPILSERTFDYNEESELTCKVNVLPKVPGFDRERGIGMTFFAANDNIETVRDDTNSKLEKSKMFPG
jgi:hypothetical protein